MLTACRLLAEKKPSAAQRRGDSSVRFTGRLCARAGGGVGTEHAASFLAADVLLSPAANCDLDTRSLRSHRSAH